MFTEGQIRPPATDEEKQRRYERDVARLLTRSSEFVSVPCPACGASARTERFRKYSLCYNECDLCATVYVSPRPAPAALAEYYQLSESYAYWNEVIFPASEAARREHIFKPRVDRVIDLCRHYDIATGVLVEIGAGFGTFCTELRERAVFDRIIAVEPTPQLAATCRERGLEVLAAGYEDMKLDVRPDVIVSFEVIEHLFDPRAFVAACRRVIRPGGLLILTCPNVRGFDVTLLGASSATFDAEHLNYFHPLSLSRLLVDSGFDVVESLTPGALDAEIVRNHALTGTFGLVDPFMRRVLLEEWDRLGVPFQRFLASNGLSSHMWVVARSPIA